MIYNRKVTYKDEIKELKKKKAKGYQGASTGGILWSACAGYGGLCEKANYLKKEFDDDLVRRLLQTVKVINENKIEIQFQSGIVMTQRLDCWD
ncbi:hypothetical protein [Hespellia stercorisuis]|uniref:hypothetical protein n=1 Tax=Hespellia stercorisuis TaxID=180311 RepID=UPI001FA88402|nr:hypothetical protein [Hespellia stercorisuis]